MSEPQRNLQVTLKSRPQGWVRESDFALIESDLPAIEAGEVLLKTLYLSLDPYMRGRMDDAKSYAKSVNLGEVMVGGTVSEVVESKHPKFKAGDLVVFSGRMADVFEVGRRRVDARARGTSAVCVSGACGNAWRHCVDGTLRHRRPEGR